MNLATRIATFQQHIAQVETKRDGLDDGPNRDRVAVRLERMNARLAKMQARLAAENA